MTSASAWPLPAELLLLLLDDEGKPRVDSTKRKAAVAGAAVLQLVLDGALELAPGDPKRARLVANPSVIPQSQALAQTRDRAVNRKPKDAVARIGGASDFKGRANDIQESVLHELAAAGVVEPVDHTYLGVFRSTRWIMRRPEIESDITTRIAAVLDGGQPDTSTAALISIVNAIDLLPKIFPERDKKTMRRRAKQIGDLSWGGQAVSQAVMEVQAAVAASVVASTAATTS
jgi:Golgi phosphoprotein 3 (GPP34)